MARTAIGWWVFALFAGAPGTHATAAQASANPNMTAESLFNITQVWTLDLRFTPDQWQAMEPKGGVGPFSGPGGHPGPGRPGGPPGPGGHGIFGLGTVIAPIFLEHGDTDRDGKLSRAEFANVADKWFATWDTNRSGELNVDKLRAGLNAVLAPANMPGAGGQPRPRGGPPIEGVEGKRNGLASAMGVDFPTVYADLDFNGLEFPAVAVRYKGNGTFMESRGSLKRSFKVDINDNCPGRRIAGASKLNLHNNVTDASWMNEVLSYRLFREAGVPAPRTAYARLYVTVPGKYERHYVGLYSLVENVDRNFLQERFGTRQGAIFKPATRDLFADLGDDWAAYRQTYDPKTPVSKTEVARVISFCKLVTHATDTDFEKELGNYLDLDEFARFMAVTVWLSTLDSILMIGQNFYVCLHPETGLFQFIPWDLDHSFGQFPMGGTQEQRENLDIHHPWMGENRFLERVFKVAKFKQLYLSHMRRFSETLFQPERFHDQVDQIALAIRPAVADESEEKLKRFDKVVAGEAVGRAPLPGGPDQPNRPDDRFGPLPLPNDPRGLQPTVTSHQPSAPGRNVLIGAGGPAPQPVMRFGPGGFGQPPKPIKAFVAVRARSVMDQLAGKQVVVPINAPFPGMPGPGGPGAPRPFGGPGGPHGFGPAMFFGPLSLNELDTDKNGEVSKTEFTQGLGGWFGQWDVDQNGTLTHDELRNGINKSFSPSRPGPRRGLPPFAGPGQESLPPPMFGP